MTEQDDKNSVDPTEEAGETTAADSTYVPADTSPVGEKTRVPVAGDAKGVEGDRAPDAE